MNEFTAKVIDLIKDIPEGCVMTYGQIARLAGSPRGARQVVRVLHSMSSKYKLPWHRVVNAKGQLSLNDDEQKHCLRLEGIDIFNGNCIDLVRHQFHPIE